MSSNNQDNKLKPNEYWDDELMWDDIEQELDKDDKKKGFIWFFFGSFILLISVLVISGLGVKTENIKSVSVVQDQVKKSEEKNEINNSQDSMSSILNQKETTHELQHNINDKKRIERSELVIEKSNSESNRNNRVSNSEASQKPRQLGDTDPAISIDDTESTDRQELKSILKAEQESAVRNLQLDELEALGMRFNKWLAMEHDTIVISETWNNVIFDNSDHSGFMVVSGGYGIINSIERSSSNWSQAMANAESPFYSLDVEVSFGRSLGNNFYFESGLNYSRQIHKFNTSEAQIEIDEVFSDTAIIVNSVVPKVFSGYLTETKTTTTNYQAFNRYHQISIPMRVAYLLDGGINKLYLNAGVAFNMLTIVKGHAFTPDGSIARFSKIGQRAQRHINLNRVELSMNYVRSLSSRLSLMLGGRYGMAMADTYQIGDDATGFSTKSNVFSLRASLMLHLHE